MIFFGLLLSYRFPFFFPLRMHINKLSVKIVCFNKPNKPFDGVNIVFAVYFAQLPPVGGEAISLYSGIRSATLVFRFIQD